MSTAVVSDPPDLHPHRWSILAVLSLSVFLVVVDNLIVNIAIPTLSRELETTTSGLQWIVDAYALVFAGLLLAAGALGDRWGRKGTMQIGLVLFAVFSAFAAYAPSDGWLIVWRGAMGIGAALVFPATLAILINVFTDPIERAKAIGVWSAVSGAAVAFGPVAGGVLLEYFWWGSVFLINVPIVAIALFLGHRYVPTSRDPDPGRFDAAGLVMSIAAVGLLVFTVIEGPHRGWSSPATLTGFAAAALFLVGFVTWERRIEHPLLDVRVFANARFSAGTTGIFIAFFSLFGFTFLVTQYFQFVRGYGTLEAGIATLPFAVGAGVTAPFAARIALRIGTKPVVTCGLSSMAVGLGLASTLSVSSAYFGPVIISMLFIACGLALVTSPSTEAVMGAVSRDQAGVASAVNDASREVGGTLGVAVVGSVFASIYGPRVRDLLTGSGLPDDLVEVGSSSVAAGLQVAASAGDGASALGEAISSAFGDGFSIACRVAAGVAIVGALIALAALPSRAAEPAG
jgi:EmrB/QacA subfamily drug resistance transporter